MFDYNLLKTKTLCLQIYFLITESNEAARNTIAAIESGEVNSSTILVTCNKTLDFANKIINQLNIYTKDINNYVLEIDKSLEDKVKEEQVKKEKNMKKSILSLKKEKDEEFTQDEFLEIYKIDMTEDLNNSNQKTPTFKNILEEDSKNSDDNSKENLLRSDSSDINYSPNINDINHTLNLLGDELTNSPKTLNEDNILQNIGCDTSDIDSDSDTLFSGSTVILEENLEVSRELEDFSDSLNSDNDQEVNDKANMIKEGNFNLKEFSIVLSKCDAEKENPAKNNNVDEEMRQIENLINLNNLKRKHTTDDTKPNKRKKKDKGSGKDNEHTADTQSDSSATDCDISSLSNVHDNQNAEENFSNTDGNVKSAKERSEFLDDLLKCINDLSDDIADFDNSENDGEDTKNKKKTNNAKVTKEENHQENAIDDELIEIVADEHLKKKKWRRDKLLTEKLTSGSSDDEKENNPEQRQKRKCRRKVRRKSTPDITVLQSESSESSYMSDSDFEDIGSDNTYISSDSSSEVEFVKSSPTKNEEPGKIGRRNIRSVQSDALLDATTKKAQKEEEERLDRLEPRTQLLSQLDEESGLVLDFDKETKEPLIIVDENITSRLKHHQKEGLRFMWNSCYESVEVLKKSQGTGCILAHCMGLGKSFQVTALIDTLFAHEVTNTKHVLILCPLSTVLNWEDEFNICCNTAKHKRNVKRYLITDGKSREERYRTVSNWYKNNGVLIVGYDSFRSLLNKSVPKKIVEALLDPGPDLVVCDEGHMIKKGNTNRTKTLARIKTKRRIILTGTPMQNNLQEYYFMVDFVKPNLLGTKIEFSNRFINPIVNGGYDDSNENDIKLMRQRSHVLHECLKHTVQRYEITELQSYLPEKLDYVVFIQMHDLQISLYKSYLEMVSSPEYDKKKSFLVDYLRLKEVWTHPCILRLKEQAKSSQQSKRKEVDTIIIEPEIQEDMPNEWWRSKYPDDVMTNIGYGPKMNVMLEIIEHSVRLNDKVLIFGSLLAELDAIEYFLNANGWRKNVSYLRMDGTVPPDTRTSSCKKFNNKNEDRIKLFILSHQVGGLGLNLIAANRIILMDVNFNPAVDSQSIFRTYRFGQEKRCYVYRLVSMGTMEEVVYERSVTKQAVSLRVVDEHQISRHYKSNDLQKMYRFNIHTNEERPVLKLPVDEVLASILEKCKKEIFKYHEHEDLLENRPEEQLNAEEQKLAWDEYRREQETVRQNQIVATSLQMTNVGLANPGTFPLNQVVYSISQPSTSSIPVQAQAVGTSTNITPQASGYATIRLQQFASIANMNQHQHLIATQNASNTMNIAGIKQLNNNVTNNAVASNLKGQISNLRKEHVNSSQPVPNIRMLYTRNKVVNPVHQIPNNFSQRPTIRQQNPGSIRPKIISAISNATITSVRPQVIRKPNSNEVRAISSVSNDMPNLMPLTFVNVPDKPTNKTLQVTDPLAASTSALVITLDDGSINSGTNSNKQPIEHRRAPSKPQNNISRLKSTVDEAHVPVDSNTTIITTVHKTGVDCIIELD